jgi:hypothetical protein
MPWLLLFAAILLEVAGITSMKLSRGFAEPIPTIAVPVFYVLSAAAVILALKRLDLSVTLCHLVGSRHGARGNHRHRLFPRAGDFVQARFARAGGARRGRAVACRQAW